MAKIAAANPKVLKGVRGKALMIGLECEVTNADLQTKLRDAGILAVGAADNVLRFLPPLTITRDEIDEALAIFEKVVSDWS